MTNERFWYGATLLKVIDGDTIELMIDLGFNIHHKIRVRLYGVNTPESRTKDLAEKEMGLKAKSFTQDWLTNHKWVFVNTIPDKNDKYGRILARIFLLTILMTQLLRVLIKTSFSLATPVNTSALAIRPGQSLRNKNPAPT